MLINNFLLAGFFLKLLSIKYKHSLISLIVLADISNKLFSEFLIKNISKRLLGFLIKTFLLKLFII